MKVFTVVGARPQFVKAAVVSRAFAERGSQFDEVLVHTGQHYDPNMSDVFFEEMSIPRPQHNLGIGGGTHGQNTGRMIEQIESLLLEEQPDWVLVYGDTDSTLAGALAAAKLQIPIAHVEAGLRSFNRAMPEELNRILTDHLASILFAPTELARTNLSLEGIAGAMVSIVGDVMYDAALYYKSIAREPEWFKSSGLALESFVLCTVHRAENTDNPERMTGIFDGIRNVDKPVLLPLHPRTRAKIAEMSLEVPGNVTLADPVGYLEMIWLEMNCSLVITDSGGVQKEAYFHKKPCVTLRNETEWVELVDEGCNQLVGTNPDRIASAVNNFGECNFSKLLYGDGDSASRIIDALLAD